MSRIGKQPIIISQGVQFTVTGSHVQVKGPKGQLAMDLHPTVMCSVDGAQALVTVKNPEEKNDRALWGLSQRLLANMVHGVTVGFEKKLEVIGIGFKVAVSGNVLTLNLGFSHPVNFPLPDGVSAAVEKNTITLSSIDKQLVGETAARIRSLKKPEPYKGKGIKYSDETIRRKSGKSGKAGAKK
ncbi:MAG: 50S ribosomal protein L6 [Candidatus Uhrbacteria bacterium]|nr:50S ribosomal protein L6 [Candidatus Uhrbacteria bacterium]